VTVDVVLDEVEVCMNRIAVAVGDIGRRLSVNGVMGVDRFVGLLGVDMTFLVELHGPLGLPN
jgi:hypothetical protein